MNRIAYFLSMGVILSTMLLMGVVLFWSFYPYQTVAINKPVIVQKGSYKYGDVLSYNLDYCRFTDIPNEISRAYIDTVIYSTPIVIAVNPKGCRTTLISLNVPNLPSGRYQIRTEYTFRVNPIRTIVKQFYTNEFEIVEEIK